MGDTYEFQHGTLPDSESDSDVDIESIIEADPAKKKGWISKQKLINICQKEVGTKSDGRRPLNIAIIGPPGCGKSSLLNSIFASFSDEKWKELAEHGSSGELDRQISRFLISYKKEKYYGRRTDDNREDDILMPTFIDMNGFEDVNDEYNKELLKIVFYGRLEEFEKFQDVTECYRADGLNGLRNTYGQRKEYLRIDRIIFVSSGDPTAPLPTELMECVYEVAHGKRGIPIFGVVTKADKFNGKKDPAVKEREATFRKHLGIPLNRFARIKNYCEDIDDKLEYRFSVIPQIDIKILELLTQVFSPALQVINPEGNPFESTGESSERNKRTKDPVPTSPTNGSTSRGFTIGTLLILISIQMLLMSIVLQDSMNPGISDSTINTICANYKMFLEAKDMQSIPGMDEICANKIPKPAFFSLAPGIIFVMVVVPIIYLTILNKMKTK